MTDPADEIITVTMTQRQKWIIEQAVLIQKQRAREDGRQKVVEICKEIQERMFWATMAAARDGDGGGD